MDVQKDSKRRLNLIAYVCYFFTGALITTLGLVLGPVSAAFHKDPGFIGQMFTLLNFGLFVPILVGGVLMQKYSIKSLLAIASAVTIALTVVLTVVPSITLFGFTVLMIGAAAGITMAVGSYLVVRINPDPKDRSSSLIFTDFFFSFAGVVLPVILGYLFKHNASWLVMYFLMSAISLLLILLIAKAKFPTVEREVKHEDGTIVAKEPWGKAIYYVCFAAFAFIYAELVFTMWLPTYLQDAVKLPIDTAALYVTLYWGSKAIGLWLNHYTVRYVPLRSFLIVSAIIGAASIATIANVPQATVIGIALVCFGFFNSGIYSGLISYGSLQVKVSPPSLISTILTCGSVGTLIFASVSAYIFSNYGLHWALNSSVIVYVFALIGIILAGSCSKAEELHGKLGL
ncbi:MFS transporter TsgA [Iodobacter sp.]|uniref:MFS transporter TsgA n=1 Tax=Iodobacter sp. TaxID=1915058 RepID=UPI0025DACB42|nr:MFS transporter TsgA [Iodobacter sp.]